MARRIKEAPSIHRMRISKCAGKLFEQYGFEGVSMDMIASMANYSKATIYVYFESKEEIISYLTLQSMQMLRQYILNGINNNGGIKEKYIGICNGLYKYATEYPLYFKMVLSPINIDFNNSKFEANEREIFIIGESINDIIFKYIKEGIELKEIKNDLKIMPTIFNIWGMICGVIELAINKEEYISKEMNMTLSEFLDYSYNTIYNSIKA